MSDVSFTRSGPEAPPLELEFFCRRLFALPAKQVVTEDNAGTGRSYLIEKKTGRVLAVAPLGTAS